MTTDLNFATENTDLNVFDFNQDSNGDSVRLDSKLLTTVSLVDVNDLFAGYKPVPLVQGLVITCIIFALNILQNSTIFKLYYPVKTDLALYIKVLAAYDFVTGCVSAGCRLVLLVNPSNITAILALNAVFDILLGHAMLGPLFLALDRFLVVVFPHKFQLYEKKMRIFKVVLVLFASSSAIGWLFNDWNLVLMMLSINLMVHFVGCLILYSIIVACILISARKMKAHISNGYVNYCYILYKLIYVVMPVLMLVYTHTFI